MHFPEGLKEGVLEHIKRKFDLQELLGEEEIERAIGTSIQKKIDEGFRFATFTYPMFTPFFFLQVDQDVRSEEGKREVEALREEFVEENGGEQNIEFYLIPRTEEAIVLFK